MKRWTGSISSLTDYFQGICHRYSTVTKIYIEVICPIITMFEMAIVDLKLEVLDHANCHESNGCHMNQGVIEPLHE